MKKGVMGLIMEKGKLIKTLYCILFLIWFVCFFCLTAYGAENRSKISTCYF